MNDDGKIASVPIWEETFSIDVKFPNPNMFIEFYSGNTTGVIIAGIFTVIAAVAGGTFVVRVQQDNTNLEQKVEAQAQQPTPTLPPIEELSHPNSELENKSPEEIDEESDEET